MLSQNWSRACAVFAVAIIAVPSPLLANVARSNSVAIQKGPLAQIKDPNDIFQILRVCRLIPTLPICKNIPKPIPFPEV
jgi:hypothetical protein